MALRDNDVTSAVTHCLLPVQRPSHCATAHMEKTLVSFGHLGCINHLEQAMDGAKSLDMHTETQGTYLLDQGSHSYTVKLWNAWLDIMLLIECIRFANTIHVITSIAYSE